MYYNKVEICGINTAKLPVLTDEEKKELLIRAGKGDEEARTRLIDGNLRLVLSIVGRFAGRGENLDDLFQVGCIGLIKAVDNFNTDLDVKFSTYAVPMIIGELRRHLRDFTPVRVSRSVRDLAYKALNARETLSKRMADEPTVEQIVELLNQSGEHYSRKDVVCALEAIVEPVSLYDPVYSEGSSSGEGLSIMDQISDESAGDDNWLESIAISDAIKALGEREQKIINLRFYKNKTQMEIAAEIGISQAQVSRLEKSALERIRKQL